MSKSSLLFQVVLALQSTITISQHVCAFQAVSPLVPRWRSHVAGAIPSFAHGIKPTSLRVGASLPFGSLAQVDSNQLVNLGPVLLGAFFLIGYHVHLFQKEKSGRRTWRISQADTREEWSKYVRSTQQWLYAIQTLRNAITAQTFLATTVLSLLTVIGGRLWELVRKMSPSQDGRRILVTQFVVVASCMLASAYQFLQAARLMTHAGFMFPVDPSKTNVDKIMRQSENAQWTGLRFLYSSVGVIVWIVGGPKASFVSSCLLALFFRKIDQVPEELYSEVYHP
eukprot:scaffold7316_cov123-Cylindrotheca_fusiformis.AAC.4